jgi:hypothetical protein
MLQILKFIYRNGRIDFTEGWIATEEELSVIDVDPQILEELLATGRTQGRASERLSNFPFKEATSNQLELELRRDLKYFYLRLARPHLAASLVTSLTTL